MTHTWAHLKMPCPRNVVQRVFLPIMLLMSPLLTRIRQFSNLISNHCIASWIVWRLRFTKGSRNALKKVDYDNIQYLKVNYLPPVFSGNVVFEFPSTCRSSANSQAGLMVGMDKRHDRHVWTRTSISHIKNDMGLMFRWASCLGHLCCDNQDCKYLSRAHHTSQVNEMEWDGFTTTSF